MMRGGARTCGRDGQDGAVVVEFAVVFVLFVMILWGILTYGVIFAAQQTVTHAAGEAARATVGHTSQEDAKDVALGVATEQLAWLGDSGEPDREDVTFDACPAPADDQTCVYVEYAYPWQDDPLITPLFDIAIPSTLTGTAVLTWEGL